MNNYLILSVPFLLIIGLSLWFSIKIRNPYIKATIVILFAVFPVLVITSILSFILGQFVGERGEFLRQSSVTTSRNVKIINEMDKECGEMLFNSLENEFKHLLSIHAEFISNDKTIINRLVSQQWNFDKMFQRDMPLVMKYLLNNKKLQEPKYKILFDKYIFPSRIGAISEQDVGQAGSPASPPKDPPPEK